MGTLIIRMIAAAAIALTGVAAANHDAAFWSQQPLRLGNDYFVRSLMPLPDRSLVVAGDWLRLPASTDGTSTSPFRKVFVQLHGSDGAMKWNLSLHAQGSAEFSQLDYDPEAGHLIAVGRSWPNEGLPDMFAVKINDRGRVEWLREYREQGHQQANAVAIIPGGGAVMAGFTIPLSDVPVDADGLLVRIDADGNELWRYQTSTSNLTSFTDVVVQPDGLITVAGVSHSATAGYHQGSGDVIIMTFDPEGTLMRQQQFGTQADDNAFRLIVDNDSNLFMLGDTLGALGTSSGSRDMFVAKFNRDGERLWLEQYGGNDDDKLLALAVDEAGHVYSAGVLGMHIGDDATIRSVSLAQVGSDGVTAIGNGLTVNGAVGGSVILTGSGQASLLFAVNAGEGWRLLSVPGVTVSRDPVIDTGD